MNHIYAEKIPAVLRPVVNVYAESLVRAYGDTLESFVVYGSAASGDFVRGASDINCAAVVKDMSLAMLEKGARIIAWGARKNIPAPLFFTRRSIEESKDVFALEFLEIKENHILLYGEDIFNTLDIPRQYLRLSCEARVRGMLVRVRQAYLELSSQRRTMSRLLQGTLNDLMPVLRTLLRIQGKKAIFNKQSLIHTAEETYGLDGDFLSSLLMHAGTRSSLQRANAARFIEQLTILAQKIDVL